MIKDFSAVSSRFRVILAALIGGALLTFAVQTAYPSGAVGDGTPESCTEAALDAALAGGGLVTFDCGPNPHTIVFTFTKSIADDTEIQGGDLITLSGGNNVPHFQVYIEKTLTLRGITLSHGSGANGSIENFGTLRFINSTSTLNVASDSGGAVLNFGTVEMANSRLVENKAENYGGGINNGSGHVFISGSEIAGNIAKSKSGGGIWSNGELTMTNSSLSGNEAASAGGGGIFNEGTLQLTQVTFEKNMVSYAGAANGGGLNHADGTATLEAVTFDGNSSNTYGGGLYIGGGSLTANGSRFMHNEAVVGGAISNSGTFALTNSLVFDNTASSVAGVANGMAGVAGSADEATLINVTISDNKALSGSVAAGAQSDGGLLSLNFVTVSGNEGYGIGRAAPATAAGADKEFIYLAVENSIIAGNLPNNCKSGIVSAGHNIAGDNSCLLSQVSDRSDTDPLLGPLADNGGPTETYLPGAGSKAIDGGLCTFGVTTDQRGAPRPFGGACDVGAVEVGAQTPDPTPTAEPTPPAGTTWSVYLPAGLG